MLYYITGEDFQLVQEVFLYELEEFLISRKVFEDNMENTC
jgi:hypothetical protein